MPPKITSVEVSETIHQWDALAHARYDQISSGVDITYRNILVPRLSALIPSPSTRLVVDAGCGVGFFTDHLKGFGRSVVGIDPSKVCIEIARTHFDKSIDFLNTTLEDFSRYNKEVADLVVANMVLMDVLDLDAFLAAANDVLVPKGVLIFSITHPCFWPRYAGYANESWFHYDCEVIVEAPFRISTQKDGKLISTHVHRPIESYIRSFTTASFSIEIIQEPMPDEDTANLYPEAWEFPRYLIGRCQKI